MSKKLHVLDVLIESTTFTIETETQPYTLSINEVELES